MCNTFNREILVKLGALVVLFLLTINILIYYPSE